MAKHHLTCARRRRRTRARCPDARPNRRACMPVPGERMRVPGGCPGACPCRRACMPVPDQRMRVPGGSAAQEAAVTFPSRHCGTFRACMESPCATPTAPGGNRRVVRTDCSLSAHVFFSCRRRGAGYLKGSPRRMELSKRAMQSMRVPACATLSPQLSTCCARSPHAQAHGAGEEEGGPI
jgi:hypothetical protein